MILCLTLNSCLDKTLTVPTWRPGDNVRGSALREVVGGKGNNVARALFRLGRQPRPVTFLGGPIGRHCEELLHRDDGLDPLIVPTQATTRTILTVRTEARNDQTAFFDPDPGVTEAEADAFYAAVERALDTDAVDLVTLSGSSPAPATHHLFSDIISLARSHRVPVLLDTYGPALEAIWGFWPDVLQLNRREATGYLGSSKPVADDDIFGLLADWGRHGVQLGIVTNGADAVLAQVNGERYRVVPPEIEAVNPIGSGDCLLAGIADGLLQGLEVEPLLKRAIACAVSNALTWDAGAIQPEELDEIANLAVVESLGCAQMDATSGQLFRRTPLRRR